MKYLHILLVMIIVINCSNNNNLGETRNFQFIYKVELNQSNQKVELWIPIPKTNEVQIISNEKLDLDYLYCEKLTEFTHQNDYYYCSSDYGLDNDIIVTYSCDVQRTEHSRVNYNNVHFNNYGKGTNNITVPEGRMFLDIIEENKLIKDDIKSVYDYVLTGMHYGKPDSKESQYYNNPWLTEDGQYGQKRVSRDQVVSFYEKAKLEGGNYTFGNGNSIYACDIGVGNCTDYHSYFMSLSRTMDIPSRFHMGFLIPNEESGRVRGYHCWADYYVKGDGWYPVDISEADKSPEKADYFFGKVCNNRVEFSVGRDLELKNYTKHINFFVYPLVEGTTYSKEFSYKNI